MRAWGALAAGAALYAMGVWWAAARLPADGVPLHFDAAGLADRFGTRTEALTMHVAVAVGALVLVVGVVSLCLVRWGPLSRINVPHKEYWSAPARRRRLRRMMTLDVGVFFGVTVAAMGLVPVVTVLALAADPVGLPALAVPVTIGIVLVGALLWCVWLARYRYRPDPRST